MPRQNLTTMKLPSITVRRATVADAPTLTEFNIAMALETEDYQLDPSTVLAGVTRLFQQQERGFYLIAEFKNTVIGALMITKEWSDWRDGLWWWIQSVYVIKAHRRRGAFRTLYDHVCELAQTEDDVCGIRLYVEKDNVSAQSVYREMGMSEPRYRLYEVLL